MIRKQTNDFIFLAPIQLLNIVQWLNTVAKIIIFTDQSLRHSYYRFYNEMI